MGKGQTVRLSLKLLLISELVLLVAVLVLVVPVWNAMRGQVVDNMQNELKAIASTAALQLDGDLHNAIRTMEHADLEAFGVLRRQLREVQRANGIALNHIYTFYRDGDQAKNAVRIETGISQHKDDRRSLQLQPGGGFVATFRRPTKYSGY